MLAARNSSSETRYRVHVPWTHCVTGLSQSRMGKYCAIAHLCDIQNSQIHRDWQHNTGYLVLRRGVENRKWLLRSHKSFHLTRWMFWGGCLVRVAHPRIKTINWYFYHSLKKKKRHLRRWEVWGNNSKLSKSRNVTSLLQQVFFACVTALCQENRTGFTQQRSWDEGAETIESA